MWSFCLGHNLGIGWLLNCSQIHFITHFWYTLPMLEGINKVYHRYDTHYNLYTTNIIKADHECRYTISKSQLPTCKCTSPEKTVLHYDYHFFFQFGNHVFTSVCNFSWIWKSILRYLIAALPWKYVFNYFFSFFLSANIFAQSLQWLISVSTNPFFN